MTLLASRWLAILIHANSTALLFMASSPTLGDALKRVARYSKITNESLVVGYKGGNNLIIDLSYFGVSRHSDIHQIEFCIFGVLRICRMLTGRKLVPQTFLYVSLSIGTHLRNDALCRNQNGLQC